MEGVNCVLCFKKAAEHSCLSQYQPISLLTKLIESIISKNNFLNDKQYRFNPGRSTADVFTVTMQRIGKIDNKLITKIITIDISKAFDENVAFLICRGP